MNRLTDQELLRNYVERKSDVAFAELVRRHVDHVYSAALRMVCDPHLAQDVAQNVFVALAQNAQPLAERPVLSGWLHRTAQNLSANAVRSEVRRRAREQEAAAINQLLANESDVTWETIAPQLDAAIGELNETERDALMLRYFERKSAREMAGLLGTSEDTAQKRVNRAVDSLRETLSKRRLTVGAAGLSALISANAVQSAPAALATMILNTAIVTTSTLGITMIHKILITGMAAIAVGTGIYAFHMQSQIGALEQQQSSLRNQIAQVEQERDDATNQLADLQQENEQLQANQSDLLRLRGEVTRLRSQSNVSEDTSQTETNKKLASRIEIHMKARFFLVPSEDVPLLGVDWLSSAQEAGKTGLLAKPKFSAVMSAFHKASDVEEISAPEVTSLSGQQTEMRATRPFNFSGTNVDLGEILDTRSYFETNSSKFDMNLGAWLSVLRGDPSKPDFQNIYVTNRVALSSNQVAVLEADVPTGSWLPDHTNMPTESLSLVIFVAPSLVDAKGLPKPQ